MVYKFLKRIKKGFGGLKLNVKFMLLIILFIEITIGIFSAFFFRNMKRNVVQENLNQLEYEMDRQYVQICKNVEQINMSTQFFLNDQTLLDFLIDVKAGKKLSPEELEKFYHENVAYMERMVNSNLYLYQIRLYVDSDIQEMMPVLYVRDRMKRLEWAQDEVLPGWKFNYTDAIFDTYTVAQNEKLLSLVTLIEDYEHGELAVLEATMKMETMFEEIYDKNSDITGCFLDESGRRYYGTEESENAGYLESALNDLEDSSEGGFYYDVMDGEDIVAGCFKIKELPGTLVCIRNISKDVDKVRNTRNLFILLMALIAPFLAAVVNMIVKSMLQRFYQILGAMERVRSGDLDVVIENCGTDEMGELGNRLNQMLAEIKHLMDDSLSRELLIKNSEIKALQNQINAHFIYNVLESIKMMAEVDEEYEISDAITALGKLLRYSMRWVSGNVTVKEEIEYIKNYLKLINLRFDYEIYLSLNIPDVLYNVEIPKMSLQPIVENAIYHGIEQMAEDTNIYIKGIIREERCIIEITDAGRGMSEEEVQRLYARMAGEMETEGGSGNGIGLKNVQDRIKMSFGSDYGIEIASKLGCYTKVMVRVPLHGGTE